MERLARYISFEFNVEDFKCPLDYFDASVVPFHNTKGPAHINKIWIFQY